MDKPSALIVGAGIAGPTLAFWLNRRGFEVTVVEAAPGPRAGGQAVDIRGSARAVCERMGLLEQLRAHHTGVTGMSLVDERGGEIARLANDVMGDSGGFIADLEILRSDLADLLYARSRDGVEYVFGDTVTGLAEDAGGVDVSFRHRPPGRFRVVVGADGVHSAVRRRVFGPEQDLVRDLGVSVAIFRMPAQDPGSHYRVHTLPARAGEPRGRTAAIYPLPHRNEQIGMLFFPKPAGDPETAFASDGWEVPSLLEAMRRAPDLFVDDALQVHPPTWWRGRIGLLGDAAYAGSALGGNGTSTAIVGAYVLAGELASRWPDHEAAFTRYQAGMAEFVRRCQDMAGGGVEFHAPGSRLRYWFMTQMMRTLPLVPWRGAVMIGMQKTANLVAIRDYEVAPGSGGGGEPETRPLVLS